ncbi:MAG: hypothetical protein M5R42_19990 [Rhodocyclaceae bacterium]|nr:hypothetical protein [Rhodocyclaceae bacterium]
MLQVFLVVFAVVAANFLLRRILERLEARAQTATPWDDALISAARRPRCCSPGSSGSLQCASSRLDRGRDLRVL